MDRLVQGYLRFRDGYYAAHEALFRDLALRGQRPTKMMVGCSDARVDPAITFDTAPGDVFMVRNVANLVPPYAPDADFHGTSAALEFAVKSLEVSNIIILGHARCGGIANLMGAGAQSETDFIAPWMRIIESARDRARQLAQDAGHAHDSPEACRLCEMEGVKVSLENLLTFPWIRARVGEGALTLHGWYFDLTSGALHRLSGDQFERI
ncbi:MAG TPA: carbonic anhydrase [Alphaproteobacteria bacterium]|nr:carbonic anhydrase [Alphaproteobacteria bacterium]